MTSRKWTQEDMPDLTGKVIVVTGANSGLGYESSKTFAGKGATVVMAVRSLEKGKKARSDILKAHPNASLDLMQLDVGSLDSVSAFAAAFALPLHCAAGGAQQVGRNLQSASTFC